MNSAIVESSFVRADELSEMLSISKSYAYKIIRELNKELKGKGKIVVSGRISRSYLEKRLL